MQHSNHALLVHSPLSRPALGRPFLFSGALAVLSLATLLCGGMTWSSLASSGHETQAHAQHHKAHHPKAHAPKKPGPVSSSTHHAPVHSVKAVSKPAPHAGPVKAAAHAPAAVSGAKTSPHGHTSATEGPSHGEGHHAASSVVDEPTALGSSESDVPLKEALKPDSSAEEATNRPEGPLPLGVKVALALMAVLGIALVVLRGLAPRFPGMSDTIAASHSNPAVPLTVLSTLPVGQQQVLRLVQVMDDWLLMLQTPQGVQVLHRGRLSLDAGEQEAALADDTLESPFAAAVKAANGRLAAATKGRTLQLVDYQDVLATSS